MTRGMASLGGKLLEWVTLGYPGEKCPVVFGIVSHSFVARSINSVKPITYKKKHAREGPGRSYEGKTALLRLTRQLPFSNSTVLKHSWVPNRPLSARTLRNRLRVSSYRAHRPIRRPMVTLGQKTARLTGASNAGTRIFNLGRKIYWSDESRFLLHFD